VKGDYFVGLIVAFVLGLMARDYIGLMRESSWEVRGLPLAEVGGAGIDPAPASPLLQVPLCEHGNWVASCSDGRACRWSCLGPLRVDHAGAAALEPKGNFERPVHRRP
jgi:hypothetical protein